ncbi:MAG: hydroxyacylglutathione hydrolase [Rubrivivax sp.]|nr:hydroxyacylglutathione hydrolase [Rubrivivax sp.]
MKLAALPAFADNYIWMLHDGVEAVVVDPGDEGPVIAALDAMSLQLTAILVTHYHADHVGGVDALRPRLRGPVYAPAGETIPEPNHPLMDGDQIQVLGHRFQVMDVPGHTAGHIAYVQQDAEAPLLFCGDTLFSGGCGRLFEGTPAQMHLSLQRLAALPDSTQVCCTHEYTLSNLRFAAAVEPHNAALQAYTAHCQAERAAGRPTLPSRIALERQINPFLRSAETTVVDTALAQGASGRSGPEVFAALRRWKDNFR